MSGERGRAYKADRSFRVDLGVRRLGFRAQMTFFIGMLLLGWFEAVLWDSLMLNRREFDARKSRFFSREMANESIFV